MLKAGKWPLYRSGDAAAGETNGQGTGGVWFVVGEAGWSAHQVLTPESATVHRWPRSPMHRRAAATRRRPRARRHRAREDLVESSSVSGSEVELERAERALELLDRARPDDRCRHGRLVEQPRQRDVGGLARRGRGRAPPTARACRGALDESASLGAPPALGHLLQSAAEQSARRADSTAGRRGRRPGTRAAPRAPPSGR